MFSLVFLRVLSGCTESNHGNLDGCSLEKYNKKLSCHFFPKRFKTVVNVVVVKSLWIDILSLYVIVPVEVKYSTQLWYSTCFKLWHLCVNEPQPKCDVYSFSIPYYWRLQPQYPWVFLLIQACTSGSKSCSSNSSCSSSCGLRPLRSASSSMSRGSDMSADWWGPPTALSHTHTHSHTDTH